ncbi:MAG: hypothetical protein CMJ44_00645 [Pimelobacter sp.]|nr:hypothetical protein [Pimelobacter sp.]
MTHLFHVGEPVSTRAGSPLAAEPGEARAVAGPGGIQVVVAVADPGEDECRAVETGAISVGVSDEHGATDGPGAALLVRVGEPGSAGFVEAVAPVEAGVWWGGDVELALSDGRGVVRAVRRFRGPTAERVTADPAPGSSGRPSRG